MMNGFDHDHDHDRAQAPAAPPVPVGSTGHEEVDRVLASLPDLAERPLGEHGAAFEAIHDEFRRLLRSEPPIASAGEG